MNLLLGSLPVSSPLFSAPLADLSDAPFRRLITKIGGCGVLYSSMLSLPASRAHRAINFSMDTNLLEAPPFCLQIIASEPSEALAIIDNAFSVCKPSAIDVNMGCAAPRILRAGAGASLMTRPKTAQKIVSSIRKVWSGPLLAKIRAGDSELDYDLLGFCNGLVDMGLDGLVFHGRLIREKFTRTARWDPVSHLSIKLPIPVIGNGDIKTASQAAFLLKKHGCAGVMIGRAALSNPWIFAETRAIISGQSWYPPANEEIATAFLTLIDDISTNFSPGRAISRIKKIAPYILAPFDFGRKTAIQMTIANNFPDQRRALAEFFEKTL